MDGTRSKPIQVGRNVDRGLWALEDSTWKAGFLLVVAILAVVSYLPLAVALLCVLLFDWASKHELAIPLVILLIPVRQVSLGTIGEAQVRVGDVVLAAVGLIWLARKATERPGPSRPSTSLEVIAVLFVLLNVLSVVWAEDKAFAILRAGKLLRNYALFFLIVDYLARGFDKNLQRLGTAMVLAGWAVLGGFAYSFWTQGGLAAFRALLTVQELGSQGPELVFLRLDQGATIFFADIANWTMMTVFLAAGLLPRLQNRRPAFRRMVTYYTIAGTCAVFLSLTRGAIVALVVGMLFLGPPVLKTLGRRHRALILVGLAVAIGLVAIGFARVIAVHFASIPTDLSQLQRLDLWSRAVEAFMSAPWLGVGAGNVILDTYIAVHNLFLQVLGELGLLGAAVFSGLLFCWLGALIRLARQPSQLPKNFVLVRSVLAASVAYLVYSLVSAEAMEGMEPWILLGVTTALVHENQPSAAALTVHKLSGLAAARSVQKTRVPEQIVPENT